MAYNGWAILPTGESMNPRYPGTATYWDKEQVAYVLFKLSDERTRPTRVVTSFGSADLRIGDEADFYHDQTGAQLGRYMVVGIADYRTMTFKGEVPDRALKHSVFK